MQAQMKTTLSSIMTHSTSVKSSPLYSQQRALIQRKNCSHVMSARTLSLVNWLVFTAAAMEALAMLGTQSDMVLIRTHNIPKPNKKQTPTLFPNLI